MRRSRPSRSAGPASPVWLKRGPRDPNRWTSREADRAYVVGLFGTTRLPETGAMRPERLVWGAAALKPERGWPVLWRYQEGQGFAVHAVHKVYCGTRRSLWLACEDARDWALHATRDLEEGAESEFVAIGNLGEFEARTGGLVKPTIRSMPEPEPYTEPGETGGMDDWELWDWERDRPVLPSEAVVTRDAIGLSEGSGRHGAV